MSHSINQVVEIWWGWMWPMFWQAAVVVVVVWVADLAIRRRVWPQVRYALWLLVLLKLVLPPWLAAPSSVTWRLAPLAKEAVRYGFFVEESEPAVAASAAEPGVNVSPFSDIGPIGPPVISDASAGAGAKTVTPNVPGDKPDAIETSGGRSVLLCWKSYAMLVWLLGVAVLTGWLILRFRQLRRRHLGKKGRRELPARLEQLLTEAANKLRLRQRPEVVLSRDVVSPAVFGFFRPVLLLPAGDIERRSRKELEHVLLHELAHIKRGDLKLHGFYMVLQIVYWFNPLLWLVRRQLQHLRELCCDAAVARILRGETTGYRKTILETARRLLARPVEPGMGLLGLFEDSSRLMVRLKWLEKKTWKYRGLRIATVSIIVAVMTACVLPMAKGSRGQKRRIAQLVKQLQSDNESSWKQAAKELEGIGPPAAEQLAQAFRAGGQADVRAVNVLETMAGDSHVQDVMVRGLSADAHLTNSNVRHCSLIVLAESGNGEHVRRIIPLFQKDIENGSDYSMAGIALGRLGGDEAYRALVEGLSNDIPDQMRWMIADHLAAMRRAEGIPHLKDALKQVDPSHPSAGARIVEAIHRLENKNEGRVETYPSGLHSFTLRGFDSGHPQHGILYGYDLQKAINIHVEKPVPAANPDETMVAGLEALAASSKGDLIFEQLEGVARFQAYHGTLLAPVEVKTEPPHHYWTDAIEKMHQKDLKQLVLDYNNRHAKSVAGRIADFRIYPFSEGDFFAGLLPSGQIAVVKAEKIESNISRVHLSVFYLDPLLALVGTRSEDSVAGADKRRFKAALANDGTAAPKLEFLCWQSEAKSWWQPNGSVVSDEKSVRILKNVRRVGCGDGSHPEYEWVKLLFSHPLFDEGSPVALRMYNDSAEQVKFVSTIAQAGEQASPEVGSRGWITCTVSVGRKEEFPGKCSFELDYAIGSWQTKIQHISKESSGIVSLDDSFLLGDMGTNSEGKAFISYFGNPKKTAHKQHRFVAVTEEGVQIPSGRTTGSNPEVCKYEYRYDVPLKDIQYFQFETRPVKRVRYENVSLRPGVKTEVEIDGFDEKRFDLTYLGRVEQGYTDLGSPRRQKPPTDVSRDLRWVDQESGKILFDIGDIVRFDWDEQIFELTRQSAMDFMARLGSVGVHGHKFILKEEGRLIIYEGTLVNPFSSFSFVGPVIRHSFADDNVKPPLFEIGGGYPRGFTKGDSRFSERLKRALQQADVLSEIDVNNPPSPIERVTHGWFGERNGLRALVEVFPETFRLFRSVRVHVHLTGVDYLNEDHVVDVNATVVSGKGNSKFSTQEIFPFSRVGWRNIYVLEMNPWGPARQSTSGTVKPGRADLSIEVVTRKILDESAKEYSHPTDHVRTAPISVNILPGRRLLPEVPNAVMIGFQKGLRESDWAKALTYCSKKIKTKAAECESIEAFFKDVLPMEQIKSLPEFQIRGTRTRSDKVISYQSDVELRSPASKYRLEWNLSLRREDSNWVVGFPTKPLDIWIKHEDLKRRHANEELKFDRERIRKGFRVSLIPLNKDYVIGKPMLFRLEMKNVSSETLGPVNTTSVMVNDPMIVKDPNGNKIPYVDTDYQTAAASEFVEPGEKVVLADNYDVRSQYHITTPGKYTFRFRGFGPNPSDSVEIDIKPGQLSALEGIVESLMPILPEGWKLNRGNMPSSQIAEGERSEAVWVYLIGKTMRKGADRGIGLFLYINADRLNQKGEFLVQTRWGPVYVQSLDAELLWPDYREQIMNALNIQTPQARPEVEVENAEDTASNDTGKSKETELPKEKGKFGTVDFDGYFEDSAAGGELLEQLWNDPKKDLRDTDEILEMVRKGLRRYGGRGNILRWIGNLFIWGKSPQNEKAVELMYHASGSDDRRLYGDAIYFGLSVTKNKTPEILRAMAAVAMKTDDYHNVTGRILWGCRSQKEELIACLDPYLNSDDEAVHKKAQDVKDYFTDSKAFMAKRAEEYKESIREKYGDRLGQFRDELLNGNSQTRLDTLNLLRQKGVMSIVDESFLEAFGACTKDPDPKVRARTARTIGNKFVWGKTQSQEAIEILTELLGDSDRETRYAAVYYGLSTLRNPDKELVGKMLATILDDREINYYGRVIWGLRRNKQACSNILEEWMSQSEQDGQRAIKAYEIYEDVLAERLPGKYAEEFAGQRSNAHEGLVAMCVGTNPLKKEELKRQFLEHVASGKLTEKVLDFYIIEGRGTATGMFVCENLADRNALRDALTKDHAFHVAGYMHGKIGPTGSGWIDSLKRFRERSELYRVSLPKPDVEAEGEVSRAEVMEVIDSLADELERIAPKYPELSQYRKDAAKKRSQGNWHLSYSHNFTPPRAKRAIRPSDFGEKGFYVSFHCKAMPAPGSPKYAMFAPELTLRNLWLYLWAEVKTGPNPSPGLVDEVQSLLDAHAEKLREIDKRALSGVDQELASRAAEAMNGGDFERAQSLFVEAVKLKPDFAEAWTGVGMACVKAGDYKGAKESYESALSLHQERYRNEPSNANHVLQQIHLLTLLARDAEAKRLLLQARRRHPQDEQLKRFEQAGFSALQDDPQFILPHIDGVYHVRKAPARAIERIRQEQAGSSSAPPTGDSKPSADKVVRDLKAILLCKTKTVKAGERVAVELFLENMSEREIVFCDTREWISHLNVTALVDGKELRGYVRLDERGDIHPMSINSGPDSMNTEPYNLQYMDSFMESPREVFRVLEPGQKIAYLRMGLEQIRFKEETSKQALQPLQIPGEHIIQVEYQNSATAREFGLDAWTGKVRSNVVTVRVVANPSMYAQGTAVYGAENIPARMLVDAAIAVPVTEVKNLLSKLEKLEKEHLKIIKGKLDSMSKGEKKRFFTHNMAIESGLERKLSTLSEETARSMAAFGEPGVPILLEELRGLSWQSDYSRNCIGAALGHIGRPAVTYLIEALQSGGPNDKTAGARYKDVIISTLGQIGDSRAVEPLLDLFEKNKRAAIRWTSTIATALGLIGDRRAVQPLVSEFDKYLTHAETSGDWDANSPHMRAFAAALGRIGDKRAIPVLKRALNARPQTTKAGKQYLVAEEAAQALRSLGQVVEEITGHVLSPGGRRLAGAEISIDRGNAGIIHSNKRGEFSYYGYCYLLEATHGDWPGHKALASPQGPADSINLTLQRTQKFEERILDEKSEPISGARVTLQVFVGTSASGFATVWSGISDSSGSFVIEETVPGTPYRMVIYAVGYSRAITESFFLHETGISTKNGSDMPRIMRMHPGRGVTFRVLDPAGKPLPNAEIIVGGKDWPYGRGRTDNRGRVAIADIPRPEQLLEQTRARQVHVHVYTEEIRKGQWHQQDNWHEPDDENKVTLQLGASPTSEPDHTNVQVEEILNRLYVAVEKAYADVGLTREDLEKVFSVQMPSQKLWKPYQDAWPAIVKAREAAIAEMASLGPDAVPILLRAKDESDERRGADIFVLAITKIGSPAVPAAIDGLSHTNPVVRARAAAALGRIGDRRAVGPLVRSLSDPRSRVINAAVRSLGQLRDSRAAVPLLELWHRKETGDRRWIASALGNIGDKRAVEPIVAVLEGCVSQAEQTGNWDTNSWAMSVYAGALGQIGDSRAIPVLKKTLRAGPQRTKVDPPKYLVAEAAAAALRKLGVKVEGAGGSYRIIEIAPPVELATVAGRVTDGQTGRGVAGVDVEAIRSAKPVDGVRMMIISDKKEFKSDEAIRFNVRLRNDGDGELIAAPCEIGFVAVVDGEEYIHDYRSRMDLCHRVRLAAGEEHTVSVSVGNYEWLRVKNESEFLEMAPGEHTFQVKMEPEPSSEINGAVYSDVVTITVAEPRKGSGEVQVEPGRISWGEAADGLQLGLAFESADEVYGQGDVVGLGVYVQNVGDDEAVLIYHIRGGSKSLEGSFTGPHLRDSEGQQVGLRAPIRGAVIAESRRVLVRPGEIKLLGKEHLGMGTNIEGGPVDYSAAVEAGQYRVHEKVRLGIAKGQAWVELTSGDLALTVESRQPRQIAWGQVVDGLQLGLSLDREDGVYRQDELVGFTVYARNAGDKEVPLVYEDLAHASPGLQGTAEKPMILTVHLSGGGGGVEWSRVVLGPGDTEMLGKVQLQLEPLLADRQAEHSADLEAGEYPVSQTVKFGSFTEEESWRGQLTTGELELVVEELMFGPVIEQSLNDQGEPGSSIDFDTQRTLTPEMETRDGVRVASFRLCRKQGIDAIAQEEPGGLAAISMEVARLDRSDWGTMAPPELAKLLKDRNRRIERVKQRGYGIVKLRGDSIFGFKTRDGGLGMVRIVDFKENPWRVKIWYKMAQKDYLGELRGTVEGIQRRNVDLAGGAGTRPVDDDTVSSKPVEIRADTEKRHGLDEYPYQQECRDGATHVLGTIHGRVVWSSEKNPYVMDENVWVAKDGTLIIESGVVVKVVRLTEPTSLINAYVGLMVQGTLTAEGQPDAMIRFTSASEEPIKYREWQGLVFGRSSPPSVLKWTLIEDAIFGVRTHGSPLIAHCVFRECHTGIYLERGFVGDVVHNVSAHNLYSGIRCKGTRAEATIINNILYENGDGIRGWLGAVAYADYNLYWSSKAGHHYSGIEAGEHDLSVNPAFSDVEADDFHLAETSPARGAGFKGADMGLFVRGWSEESTRLENEAWSGWGARSLWYASLAIARNTRRLAEARRNCEAALRKDAPLELKDKISCTLGQVLTMQKHYEAARQTLAEVVSNSRWAHLRDLARRYLAEAWARQRRPQEALATLEALERPQSHVWAESAKATYKAAAGAHEEALRTLEPLKGSEPERYLKAVSEMILNRVEANDLDAATALLSGFEEYPLAEEIAGAYLSIAKAARAQRHVELAAELLAESCDIDPFSKEAPESLFLLAEILESDLHQPDDADAVRAELCTYYFPHNPHVAQAKKKLLNRKRGTSGSGWALTAVNGKRILLDGSLKESSIFDRCPTGSCNFGQYEVIRVLSDAGYVVHVNSYQRLGVSRQGRRLTPDVVKRYGLIVCNGRYGGTAEPPIDQDIIDNLVAYVHDGGSLLVVAAGMELGSGKMAQLYNPLVEQFGIRFEEDTDLRGRTGAVADHPAMKGLTGFWAASGVPVFVEEGEVLGYVDGEPAIAITKYGKGKVIAAGLGSGFLGACLRDDVFGKAEARQNNRELLVNLVSYLLASQ